MLVPVDILFVHTNFPGQYKLLAQALATDGRFRLFAIGSDSASQVEGVILEPYTVPRGELAANHSYARRFELECRRSEQVMYAATMLKLKGIRPRVIFVHPGWGEALPLRRLFPNAKICVYCEFYYRTSGADVGFDPEFGQFGADGLTRVHLKNAANLLALVEADAAIAPTHWQRSLFPSEFQRKIQVIHDGIDTAALVPRGDTFKHPKLARTFTTGDEVLTYVARNLEPYRGFHIFMRALPAILERRPNAHVCIVGGESVSYGALPDGSKSWKSAFLKECAGQLDMSRVHFLGHIDYDSYVSLLRVSRAHVYLTYPFVLSWSLLEAMALECLVVASDTAPVTEVIRNNDNGIIVPFFDPAVLASRVSEALSSPEKFSHLKKNARRTVLNRYCFKDQCYPRIIALLEQLIVDSEGKFSSPRASLEPYGRRKLLIPHGLA